MYGQKIINMLICKKLVSQLFGLCSLGENKVFMLALGV